MKQDGSNWSDNGLAAPGAVLLRQEAAVQGLTDPKIVWQCTSACYDLKAMTVAGDVMNGEYVDLGFLPFAEAKSNKTLASFLKYVGKDNANAFAVYGFEAVLAFQQAATAANKSTDGLTRTSLLTALKNITSFDAGGMVGSVNIGGKVPTSCFMLVQWNKASSTGCTRRSRARSTARPPTATRSRPTSRRPERQARKSGLLTRRKVNGDGHAAVSVIVAACRAMRAGRSAGCQPSTRCSPWVSSTGSSISWRSCRL